MCGFKVSAALAKDLRNSIISSGLVETSEIPSPPYVEADVQASLGCHTYGIVLEGGWNVLQLCYRRT